MTAPASLTVPRMRIVSLCKKNGKIGAYLWLRSQGVIVGSDKEIDAWLGANDIKLTFLSDDHAAEFALRWL